MSKFKVIAIETDVVQQVRATRLSPGYGHPVTAKVATGHGPCRHCLRPFAVGMEVRLLFTLNPFRGVAPLPQPGPVFVHDAWCARYEEGAGYPEELVQFGAVLDGYDAEQMVRRRERIKKESPETMVREMLDDALVQYVMVRDAEAGCYDFRIKRGGC